MLSGERQVADDVSDVESIADSILLSLIDLTKACEASGDPETLMSLHTALQSRCIVLGIDHPTVLRRFLGMDAELDFPDFN